MLYKNFFEIYDSFGIHLNMSFRILAFDLSTEACSVALMIDNNIYERSAITFFQHEKQVLSMINDLLLDGDVTLQSLDCLVCSHGPGSFVGVRIGVNLAQGLALGADLPVVQVSSLEVLAQGIWRLIGETQVLTTINARSGELYLGCYCYQDNNRWLKKGIESIISYEDMSILVSQLEGKWVLVGTGWDRSQNFLSDDNNIVQISQKKMLFPSARDMISLAIFNLRNGNLLSVDQIQPVYIETLKWDK